MATLIPALGSCVARKRTRGRMVIGFLRNPHVQMVDPTTNSLLVLYDDVY